MKSILHLFLFSYGLFSFVCDLAIADSPIITRAETKALKKDKKSKANKKDKSSKKGKSENDRVRLTGDEEVVELSVDKDAIRNERNFNRVDVNDDNHITLEDILTYFQQNECVFPFIWESNGTLNTYDQCTTDNDVDGYEWCSIETDDNDLHKEGFWKYCNEDETRAAWSDALKTLDTNNDGKLTIDETIDYGKKSFSGKISLCNNPVGSALLDRCRRSSLNLWYKKDGVGECIRFYTNPKDIETDRRDTWIKQVRRCGHYREVYNDSECRNSLSYTVIEANVDYPGRGPEGDLVVVDTLYLTRFDVGRHANQPASSNKNINFNSINLGVGSVGTPQDIMQNDITSETCVETFAFGGEDFGDIYGNDYNCMGYCGTGCTAWGNGKDCMKHDVCSSYKALVQGSAATGYAGDVDCGDEAAQAVINCWDENGWWPDFQTVCDRSNNDIYAEINPIARFLGGGLFGGGRQEALDRTGWNRNQGMPRPWNFPE